MKVRTGVETASPTSSKHTHVKQNRIMQISLSSSVGHDSNSKVGGKVGLSLPRLKIHELRTADKANDR